MASRLKKAWDTLLGKSTFFGGTNHYTPEELQAEFALIERGDIYPMWNFPTMATFAFERNVVAYKGVMEVSKAVGGLCWYLKNTQTNEEIRQPNHPLLTLLRAPNKGQAQSTFFQHATASKMLDGNIFIEMNGPFSGPFTGNYVPSLKTPPTELYILRPDWVSVVPGGYRLPLEYVFIPGGAVGGKARTFQVDQVSGQCSLLHIKSYTPLLEDQLLRGLSPMRSAILQVLTHNAGQQWNKGLLENGARPSGAFTTGPGREGIPDLTQQQVDDLKKEIARAYGGGRNAGKPMLLSGGLTFKEMSLNPKDADYLNLKNSAARDILLPLGVPPMLLGIPGDNTFSNYQEARLAFYEETVLPEARQLRDELNRWLTPYFGSNIALDIDEAQISALATRQTAKIASISNASFLTINEKRRSMGYPDVVDGDVVILPMNSTSLAEVIADPADPDDGSDDTGDDDQGDPEE
jgi:phage portal protein BeeE